MWFYLQLDTVNFVLVLRVAFFLNYRKHWNNPKVKSIKHDTYLRAVPVQLPTTTTKGTELLVIGITHFPLY